MEQLKQHIVEHMPIDEFSNPCMAFFEQLVEISSAAAGFSGHFHVVKVQHAAFIADQTNPDPETLYILWDMQEIMTLPLAPVELSTWWFANSRMAVSTMGMLIWHSGPNGPVKEIHTILSRCMEKGTEYVVAIMDDLFVRRPDYKRFRKLVLWADGAPNLKGSRLMGSIGYGLLDRQGFWAVSFKHSAPKHSKTELDGHFGCLSHARSTAAKHSTLMEVADLKACYEKFFQAPCRASATRHTIVEFLPPRKDTVVVHRFDYKCCGSIRFGFHWEVTRVDKRTKDLRSTKDPNTLSGLCIRSSGVCGERWRLRTMPVLRVGKPSDPPAVDDDEEDGRDEPELLRDTKEWRQWRCSYSKLDDTVGRGEKIAVLGGCSEKTWRRWLQSWS